jgi:3-phenylpropionate/trans-cinnamate dioxygenase ferredoxin reductase component
MVADVGCVVVGAGLTAANVVQTLRAEGYDEPITLVGDEHDRPYERPPLSKGYLQGSADASTLFVHGEHWYAEHRVGTRFGDRVVAIDRPVHRVTLATGESLGYRRLVLATGARPRIPDLPGIGLGGVHTLRTRQDSDALRAALSDGARVVSIGAGWIGLEVAAAARLAGAAVTVLESGEQPLQRVLGPDLGRYFADLHRRNGVDLRTGASVVGIVGSGGSVTGVQTDTDLVPADVVVVGVGVQPNIELAEQAGLDIDGGVTVDERLRTSDADILAAGDVANAFNVRLGHRLRVEHWDNAIRQGQLAARSILGGTARYDWLPYFYTDQFDLGMEYVGRAQPDHNLVIRGSMDSGKFIACWLVDGRVTAGMNVNVWDVNEDLRALVGRSVTADRLADIRIPLGEI